MKVVNKLGKKRRKHLWLDADQALWFFNAEAGEWFVLEFHDDGWWVSETFDTKGWPDGPFRRVTRKWGDSQ